ncbi:hypothetical protein IAD21_05624 [Abditibacteriota bacterium]|nr:hypothetical protein IAD21_05624 [Abditibacteriota bacterium]
MLCLSLTHIFRFHVSIFSFPNLRIHSIFLCAVLYWVAVAHRSLGDFLQRNQIISLCALGGDCYSGYLPEYRTTVERGPTFRARLRFTILPDTNSRADFVPEGAFNSKVLPVVVFITMR